MTKVTWLYLSDLHIHKTEDQVSRKAFDDLLGSIRTLRAKWELNLDAVFFTGDVAFSGQEQEYALAAESFDRVLDACGLTNQRKRLFVVPGNHDIDRTDLRAPRPDRNDRGTLAYRAHEDLFRDFSHLPYETINEFLTYPDKAGEREYIFAKLKNYARFIDTYISDPQISFDHNHCYFVRRLESSSPPMIVIGLNSVWLSYQDNEQGRLFHGESEVCSALAEAHEKYPDARINIAMLHHPLYWLAEKDIHRVKQHIPAPPGCALLLRGHLHCPNLAFESTPDNHLREFAAGASQRARFQAYNIVEIDFDRDRGAAYVQLQHPDLGPNWGVDNFTYRKSNNRKIIFRLPH